MEIYSVEDECLRHLRAPNVHALQIITIYPYKKWTNAWTNVHPFDSVL